MIGGKREEETGMVNGGGETRKREGQEDEEGETARRGVKILSDQVHIIGLVNIHSFLRYSEG